MLAKVFQIDVTQCQHCKGDMAILTAITNHSEVARYLKHLGIENEAPARAPPRYQGELARSTKYSKTGTHAEDYIKIVEKRSGNITGMGIRYGEKGLIGSRVFDFEIYHDSTKTRLYSLLDYSHYTLLIFGGLQAMGSFPKFVKAIQIHSEKVDKGYWAEFSPYEGQAILVRPDSHIESITSLNAIESLSLSKNMRFAL